MRLDLLNSRTDLAAIERTWKALAAVCPHSYFLSWGWIEHWLSQLPDSAGVQLAVFSEGDEPFAAGFLGHARMVRQKLFRSTAYLLNQTGNWTQDQLYIEDNAFLCKSHTGVAWNRMLDLLPGPWEELYLSGVAEPPHVQAPYQVMIANRIPAPYVDLSDIAARRKDYLALLGSNTRSQIRRCYKLYQAAAPLETTVAADTAAALEIFDEMVVLHGKSWNLRGKPGAFANPWFHNFHRTLIERRFDAGELQLVRVRSGSDTIGCIYNFVYNGVVSFYQSGFRTETDNRLKPGYVCHTEAVRHNLACGHSTYDFMASFDEYKFRMATQHRDLLWARVQKPRLKFAVERLARSAAFYVMEKRGMMPRPAAAPQQLAEAVR